MRAKRRMLKTLNPKKKTKQLRNAYEFDLVSWTGNIEEIRKNKLATKEGLTIQQFETLPEKLKGNSTFF